MANAERFFDELVVGAPRSMEAPAEGGSHGWGVAASAEEVAEADRFFEELVGQTTPRQGRRRPARQGESTVPGRRPIAARHWPAWSEYAAEDLSVAVVPEAQAVAMPAEAAAAIATLTASAGSVPSVRFAWSTTSDGVVLRDEGKKKVRVESTKAGTVTVQVLARKTGETDATATGIVHFVGVELPKALAVALSPKEGVTKRLIINATGLPSPGAYEWRNLADTSGDVAIEGGTKSSQLTVKATKPGRAKVTVTYTANVAKQLPVTRSSQAVFFRIEPAVKAVAASSGGATLELDVAGTPDGGTHAWSLSSNPIAATIVGETNDKKLKVKSTKPGLVKVQLDYTPEGGTTAATSHGALAFVACPISHVTRTTRKEVPATMRVPYAVLIDLGRTRLRDPVAFKTGRVVVESDPKPAKIESPGLEDEIGTFSWTKPAANKFIRVAAQQPDHHAANEDKVVIEAIPKTSPTGLVGPDIMTNYEIEQVELQRKVHSVTVTDTITIRVEAVGCSGVKWQRQGMDNVDANDRFWVCPHRSDPQWRHITNSTKPSEGRRQVSSSGHQHGGPCVHCSSAVREIGHWVPWSETVRNDAVSLANHIAAFTNENNHPNNAAYYNNHYQGLAQGVRHGKNLFTTGLWHSFRPASKNFRDVYHRKGRMLAVLRGWSANHGGWEWRFGISGRDDHGGEWSGMVDLDENLRDHSRRMPGYSGSHRFRRDGFVFNPVGMPVGWNQFGLCAAPRVLAAAITDGLSKIELAEIWVLPGRIPRGRRPHGYEIGSCAQCRRFLGTLLCEIGERQ